MVRVLFIVLLIPVIAFAGGVSGVENPAKVNSVTEPDKVCGVSGLANSCADSSCTGFTVCQNFEETGYDNGESGDWNTTLNGGTVDEDDTTATIMRGSQQLKVLASVGNNTYASNGQGSGDTIWIHVRVKFADATPSTESSFINVSNGYYARIRSDGTIRIRHGTTNLDTSSGYVSDNTMRHFWFKFVKGTGADGEMVMYSSTDGTRGSAVLNGSSGTSTIQPSAIQLREESGYTGGTFFDQVLVTYDGTEIGDVCE